MRTAVEEFKTKEADRSFEDALLAQVVEGMEVEVPQVMIDRQIDGMVEDFGARMQQQGINLETYLSMIKVEKDEFRKTFAEAAENNVKTSLALEAIVKEEDIEISEEEYNTELEKIANSVNIEIEKLADMIDKAGLCREIAVTKAVQLIKDSAVLLDKAPEKEEKKDEETTDEKAEEKAE
jgi:trigger factor